jgi:regulator of sirC expression with transglutaminase-like and TPR domain
MNHKRAFCVFPITSSRRLAVLIVLGALCGWAPPDGAAAAPPESALTQSAENRVDVADATEQALRHLESLSRRERIEESYLDLSLAVSRVMNPGLNGREIRSRIVEMGEAARSAWQAATTPQAKVTALSDTVFNKFKFRTTPGNAPITEGDQLEAYLLAGVVRRKSGFCEGLSVVYVVVAEQAGLPVSAVNVPIHTLCRIDFDDGANYYVECTKSGALCDANAVRRMNGLKDTAAAKKDGVYLTPLSKRQFLNLQVNALAYGLVQQKRGPAPLTMGQLVRLAEVIQRLDPRRPESLETAALIHHRNGDSQRALQVITCAVDLSQKYGAPGWVLAYYRDKQQKYRRASRAGEQP